MSSNQAQDTEQEAPQQQQQQQSQQVANRSRSASRRDRRKRIRSNLEEGKYLKTAPLEALQEADDTGELTSMQPFERIMPDSTSMDGPVTMARAERGEIPVRGSNPDQPYYMPRKQEKGVCFAMFFRRKFQREERRRERGEIEGGSKFPGGFLEIRI